MTSGEKSDQKKCLPELLLFGFISSSLPYSASACSNISSVESLISINELLEDPVAKKSRNSKKPKRRRRDPAAGGEMSIPLSSYDKCPLCATTLNKDNLQFTFVHLTMHFHDQISENLPKEEPFVCPECQAPSVTHLQVSYPTRRAGSFES